MKMEIVFDDGVTVEFFNVERTDYTNEYFIIYYNPKDPVLQTHVNRNKIKFIEFFKNEEENNET